MGAFFAGATQAPLMAILMMFEMTLSYSVVLPLMLACVAAYFMAQASGKHSMYEVTIHRNENERAKARWRGLQIADLIKPAAALVRASAGFAEVERCFLDNPVRYVYVVDDASRFEGVISLHEIKQHLLAKDAEPTASAGELMNRDFAFLMPGASLGDALQAFLTQGTERLPVVSNADERRLLGVVSKSELLLQIQQFAG
jgi:CIC family chloride channel protein